MPMAASNLRDRLRSITSASSAPASPARELPGLAKCVHQEAADIALSHLPPLALARMGYDNGPLDIQRTLFLDTETTGLSGGAGTVAFLVGLGFIENNQFVVEQYMMRDYSDEPELLAAVADRMARHDVVVTFNGKTFDMPLLHSRFTINRMRDQWTDLTHLDLLHPARRLWRRRLGSCKLSNLEDKVLRRGRVDDLPGAEVPERFFQYLKTGDDSLLEDVLLHNKLDILSLGALLTALADAYRAPSEQLEIADLYSMGIAMERIGDPDEAVLCYDRAGRLPSVQSIASLRGARYAAEADMALSLICKRRGDWTQAERIWRKLSDKNQLAARPLTELAKLYEHKRRDPLTALQFTDRALMRTNDEKEIEALSKRRERLIKKTGTMGEMK